MKEFVSKFTFGFLMAQFVPGALGVLFATMPIAGGHHQPRQFSLSGAVDHTVGVWFDLTCRMPDTRGDAAAREATTNRPEQAAVTKVVAFLLLAVAMGMLIHGVNWMVLGRIENHTGKLGDSSVHDMRFHQLPLFIQIAAAPVWMVVELGWMLTAPKLELAAMDENAPLVPESRAAMYGFLQDFYLHFCQFYAHTAYASLIGVVCLLWYCHSLMAPLWAYFPSLVSLWLLTGILFVVGRVQYASLCIAENKLVKGPGSDTRT